MRRAIPLLLLCHLVAVWTVMAAPGVLAATWYVDTSSGNDENAGSSPEAPFQFINKALSVAAPGDAINVIYNGNSQQVVVATANLTIQGWRAEGDHVPTAYPRIIPEASGLAALRIAADNVTVRYFSIMGSSGNAGVSADGVSAPVVDSCYVGFDQALGSVNANATGIHFKNVANGRIDNSRINHNTVRGVHVEGGQGTRIRGAEIAENALGVYFNGTTGAGVGGSESGDECAIVDNTNDGVRLNAATGCFVNMAMIGSAPRGVVMENGSRGNAVVNSTITAMISGETVLTQDGLLITGSDGNAVTETGFTAIATGVGVRLVSSKETVIAANYFFANGTDIRLETDPAHDNGVFWNFIDGGLSASQAGHVIGAPVGMHVAIGTTGAKKRLGNFYAGCESCQDVGGDGIFDAPYVSPDGNVTDRWPIAHPVYTDPEYYLDWSFGTGGTLFHGSLSGDPGSTTIPTAQNAVFTANSADGSGMTHPAGAANANPALATTVSGWLTFVDPPANGQYVNVNVGHAAADGSDFQAGGYANVVCDGTSRFFRFSLPGARLVVPSGRRLAARVANVGGDTLALRVGSGWSGLAASRPVPAVAPISGLLLN